MRSLGRTISVVLLLLSGCLGLFSQGKKPAAFLPTSFAGCGCRQLGTILSLRQHRLIFLVSPLEVRDLMMAFEVPDARGHLVDQVVVVGGD